MRVWQLICEVGVLWRLVELCWYQKPAVSLPSIGKSFFVGRASPMTLWSRYFWSLGSGELPDSTKKGGNLDQHFSGLKVARHSGVKTVTWLNFVDEQQAKLKSDTELARETFLQTLRCGGADEDLLNHALTVLTPDISKLSQPVSSEERARILTPPKKIGRALHPYTLPLQGEEVSFQVPRDKRKGTTTPENNGAVKDSEEANPQQTATKLLPPEHFEASVNAYRAVSRLFHQEGQRRSGSSKFTDLGQFMSEIGFEQHPTGGSAYAFLKPSDGIRERRSIVFHAHHNTSAYEGYELRRMGHRLTKNFGWAAETFSLG
jgi:hypothetical protein